MSLLKLLRVSTAVASAILVTLAIIANAGCQKTEEIAGKANTTERLASAWNKI